MKLQNIAWSLFSSISIKRNTFFTLQHCVPPSCSFAQLSMCSTPNLQEQRGTAPNQLRLECQHSHKFTNLEKEETKLFSPPSPFPALMVNHSSLAFAWFVAWWEWKSQHNQPLYLSPNEILTKLYPYLGVQWVAGAEGIQKALVEFVPEKHLCNQWPAGFPRCRRVIFWTKMKFFRCVGKSQKIENSNCWKYVFTRLSLGYQNSVLVIPWLDPMCIVQMGPIKILWQI